MSIYNNLYAGAAYAPGAEDLSFFSGGYAIKNPKKEWELDNSLNFINKTAGTDNIFQHILDFKLIKKQKKNANSKTSFNFTQSYDIKNQHITKQNIQIIRDFHCVTGEFSFIKFSRNDYSMYIIFRIKDFTKQGIGIKYLYPSNTLKIKR